VRPARPALSVLPTLGVRLSLRFAFCRSRPETSTRAHPAFTISRRARGLKILEKWARMYLRYMRRQGKRAIFARHSLYADVGANCIFWFMRTSLPTKEGNP
jgi:hypothetical protein